MIRFVRIVLLACFLVSFPARAEIAYLHHDLSVSLNPATRYLAVEDTITLEGEGTASFQLHPDLVITHGSLDGIELSAEQIRQIPLQQGYRHTLLIAYEGTLPEQEQGSQYLISSKGSFLPSEAGWYPRFEAETFTYRLKAAVPGPHKAVAPGRLIQEREETEHYWAEFRSDQPAREIVLLTGPYVITEKYDNGVRLRTYFYDGMAELAEGYLALSADYLQLYRDWIGAYPFSAFHVVAGPLPVGLGFPNLTYMGRNVLHLPFIRYSSLGHEVLHNYWGNGVFVDYANGNWVEGLTTYMADYTYALQRDPQQARQMRLNWLRDYAALPQKRDRPARSFTAKSHTASQIIGYHKVAFFFHMLRNRIGTERFDQAIRALWAQQRFTFATWKDLQRHFSHAARQDLAPLFAQWLDRTGAPRLTLGSVAKEKTSAGWVLRMTLEQGMPPFDLKVPVRIKTAAGVEDVTASFTKGCEKFTFVSLQEPIAVRVDPDFNLFRRLLPGEMPPVLRDVTLSPETITVFPGRDEAAHASARNLAAAMLEAPVHKIKSVGSVSQVSDRPLLVIGLKTEVAAFLQQQGLSRPPKDIAGIGNARVWSGRQSNGHAYVVVSADTVAALQALLRPLPHYGRAGYLAFASGRLLIKGTWPVHESPLSRHLP